MRRATIVLTAAAALSAALAPPAAADICQRRARRCSTPPSPTAKAQSEAALAAARGLAPGERIVVPVVYHLVYGSYLAHPGQEPDDLAHAPPVELTRRQTQALNRAFRGTGITFRTVEATFHDFGPWDHSQRNHGELPLYPDLAAMVRDLTANRNDVLHVFLMRGAENRAAPAETRSMFGSGADTDGILMNWDYLPYVPGLRAIADRTVRRYYFQGETLVHLVGHYAGLLDTFQEGEEDFCVSKCGQTTDLVSDTPAHRWTWEESEQLRCIPLDTCPESPGMDPMTNYMNLEPDLCASEFTPGQVQRMQRMVRAFRPYLVVPAAADQP